MDLPNRLSKKSDLQSDENLIQSCSITAKEMKQQGHQNAAECH